MTIKIILDEKNIRKKIGGEIKKKYGPLFLKRSKLAKDNIVEILRTNFINSDTYRSLTDIDGILRGEFGLTLSEASKIDSIIESFDIVHFSPPTIKVNNTVGFSFKLTFGISYKDYSDIDVSSGSFTTENGDVIPWLYWLLFAGVDTVVSDYNVRFTYGAGRSGYAIMIKRLDGSSYSVDAQYAGTISSNWVTEVILRSVSQIKEELMKVLHDNI